MSAVWVFQHLDAEPPGLIGTVLERLGHELRVFRSDRGELPRRLEPECAGLVVMGGPMAVYETGRWPWIGAEIARLREAVDAGLPVLGMCLGAQLLAAAAGARVYPGGQGKEIGWAEVTLSDTGRADPLCAALLEPGQAAASVFQWHGDTFDLPPGAEALASSARYPQQAFRVGRAAYGFQFHFEVTEPVIRDWVARWPADVLGAGLDPAAILAELPGRLPGLLRRGEAAVAAFAALLARPQTPFATALRRRIKGNAN